MLIVSVPHTGTHFMIDLLESNGIEAKSRHYNGYDEKHKLILSPIRSPKETYITWASRERKQDFYELWKTFDKVYREQNVFVLPIDTDDRNNRLKQLSEVVGKELKTDWSKKASKMRKEVEVPDLTHIYKLKVVRDFYESTA